MWDVLVEGWQGVTTHRVRSFLSGLGILFGVAAIIAILGIGEGARQEQERLIGQLGILNLLVRDVTFTDDQAEGEDKARRVSQGLSLRDVTALRGILPQAQHVGGMRILPTLETIPRLPEGEAIRVLGADPDWLAAKGLIRVEGRGLSAEDERSVAAVCLLGGTARDLLFGGEEAVGSWVRAGNVWLHVVGVVEESGLGRRQRSEPGDLDRHDRSVIVPLATALSRWDRPYAEPELSELIVAVGETALVEGHGLVASRAIARLHRDAADTTVVVPLRLLEQSRAQQRVFNLVMGMIAGISLLVGGIGIMNILFASVMERTREIGIRLAVGATPRDIQGLFLAESALVSGIGGALGILAGVALTAAVGRFTGWATATSIEGIVLAAGLSMIEGLVFGWIPARHASRMSPAIAVRHAG
ncbi:MAG: ABC transporter permease [Pseudomonadota bacterium]|nr:ABC transporter permease [Pseudomonadota bacterium]